ncbi:MAG: hypothetical protein VXZ38_00910 [Planctomycetota bacterium]|nr:hypothetical protein [Planctomycetota bacterium]
MSRKLASAVFAICLPLLPISFIGCGSGGNEVVVDTRPEEEINQEMEDYDAQMDAEESEEVAE